MKKRFLILTCVMGLSISSLAACGSGETNSNTQNSITSEQNGKENTETVNKTDETETTEESDVIFNSYADVVAFMKSDEYQVDSAAYSEEALSLMRGLMYTMMLEADDSLDMSMLSDEQRGNLNYNILNYGINYEMIPRAEGAEMGLVYENEVLNSYLAAFYENGGLGESDFSLLEQNNGHTIFQPSDAAEWHGFDTYTIYQYEDYLLIQAPCYENSVAQAMDGLPVIDVYTASVLFKITENELYPVQLVHVSTLEEEAVEEGESAGENILLEEGFYVATVKPENTDYTLRISNIQDYGTYQTFDMVLLIVETQDIGRYLESKTIYCYTAALDGNKAWFECSQEMYMEDATNLTTEEVERNNGFYGEFTIQEDGSIVLTYGVTNDTDGWILNTCPEPITFK